MKIEGNKITAEEGKVFRRKSDGFVYGNEIFLGYTYFIGGKKLDEPHLEVPEDFEETDKKVEIEEVDEIEKREGEHGKKNNN